MLFTDRLREPTIVAGILIPGINDHDSFQAIRRLERPPLNRYQLARDLVTAVLRGSEIEWAKKQASLGGNADQRAHALAILAATEKLLRRYCGAYLSDAPRSPWRAGRQLTLPNMTGVIVDDQPDLSVILYHFWQGEIREDRRSLIRAAIRKAVWQNAELIGAQIHLLTAPLIPAIGRRKLNILDCSAGGAEDDDLSAFGERLENLWERYHEENPERFWPAARKGPR